MTLLKLFLNIFYNCWVSLSLVFCRNNNFNDLRVILGSGRDLVSLQHRVVDDWLNLAECLTVLGSPEFLLLDQLLPYFRSYRKDILFIFFLIKNFWGIGKYIRKQGIVCTIFYCRDRWISADLICPRAVAPVRRKQRGWSQFLGISDLQKLGYPCSKI